MLRLSPHVGVPANRRAETFRTQPRLHPMDSYRYSVLRSDFALLVESSDSVDAGPKSRSGNVTSQEKNASVRNEDRIVAQNAGLSPFLQTRLQEIPAGLG